MKKFFVIFLVASLEAVHSQSTPNSDFIIERSMNSCGPRNVSDSADFIKKLENLSDSEKWPCERFLSDNARFGRIPSLLFKKFPALTSFSASNVGLTELSRDDLKFATLIKWLSLSRNFITKLEPVVFMFCTALEFLDLSNNEIDFIHETAFEGLSSMIRRVNLSFNKILTFKEDFIEAFQAGGYFYGCEVRLDNNRLEELTPSTEIELNSNNSEKSRRKSRLEIRFDENKLRKLEIRSETTSVNATNNEIAELKCDRNTSLITLLISGNKLGNSVFAELSNAKFLNTLDLSNNLVSSLTANSFSELESLIHLDLSRNKITVIDYGMLSHQRSIVNLDISYNLIEGIDFHVLTYLTSLETLDITGNLFMRIDDNEKLRKIFPVITSIGIDGNNWDCKYLAQLRLSFAAQGILIQKPHMLVKNTENIGGIPCKKSSEVLTLTNGNETDSNQLAAKTEIDSERKSFLLITVVILASLLAIVGCLKAKKFMRKSFERIPLEESH